MMMMMMMAIMIMLLKVMMKMMLAIVVKIETIQHAKSNNFTLLQLSVFYVLIRRINRNALFFSVRYYRCFSNSIMKYVELLIMHVC